jgi:hypothetical protein
MPVIVTSSDAIEYLEMALKVEGWSDPTTSASFQILNVVKSLQSSIDSMTTSDNGLVDQLRDMSTNWYFCAMDDKKVLAAAAAEIERLRRALSCAENPKTPQKEIK